MSEEEPMVFSRYVDTAIEKQKKEIEKLHSIIKEAREVLENKREKMTNQLLYVGCCDYEELLYQVDEEIGRILDKVEENK